MKLTDSIEDPKATAGEPSLNYIKKPVASSYSELNNLRKLENISALSLLDKNIGNLKNAEERLKLREECILR